METGLRVLGTGTSTCDLDHSFLYGAGWGEGRGATGTETITQTLCDMEHLQLQDLENLSHEKLGPEGATFFTLP